MLRRRLESQGIDVAITKGMKRNKNATYYRVKIRWSELKRHLCNPELREQLIRAAEKATENCRARNMMGKTKKDCNQIPAAKWLQRLGGSEWLKENIRCE